MALSADQRAMLELLLGRGQSYADLSALLGSPEDEVRSKARWALAELGGADPDRNVGLTDYLLGQADPIGRADAVRHLRDDPADRALAERLVDELGEIAPGADLPRLPGEARSAPHLRPPGLPARKAKESASPPRPPADPRRTRFLMALGSGGVVLVIIVLAVAGVFSGGGSSNASTTTTSTVASTSTTGATTTTPAGSGQSQTITPLQLKAVGGGPGSGIATFGLATGDQPFLDVRISNLPPPSNGQVYAAWLVFDTGKRQGYPLAPLVPYPSSGPYHNTFNIPGLAVPLIRGIKAVDITTASSKALSAEIQSVLKNTKNPKLVLPEIGTTVLRGIVPGRATTPSGTSGGGSGSGK
jgi:hypothetical protein